jgi:hypothetical protein
MSCQVTQQYRGGLVEVGGNATVAGISWQRHFPFPIRDEHPFLRFAGNPRISGYAHVRRKKLAQRIIGIELAMHHLFSQQGSGEYFGQFPDLEYAGRFWRLMASLGRLSVREKLLLAVLHNAYNYAPVVGRSQVRLNSPIHQRFGSLLSD